MHWSYTKHMLGSICQGGLQLAKFQETEPAEIRCSCWILVKHRTSSSSFQSAAEASLAEPIHAMSSPSPAALKHQAAP